MGLWMVIDWEGVVIWGILLKGIFSNWVFGYWGRGVFSLVKHLIVHVYFGVDNKRSSIT